MFHLCFPKSLPITHRQTYRHPLPGTTHLKTAVKEIRKNHTSFKKVPGTLCCPALTYIIEKGIHKISYIQHFVFAKPVADLQISRPILEVTFDSTDFRVCCGNGTFLCFINDKNFRILSC